MVSQTESLHVVPVTPYDSNKKDGQHQGRKTRSTTPKPSKQHVVPNTSARKTSQRKRQRGAAQEQAPQPSPEDIVRQGGLYFDMDGRPVFVEMKPAAFYGESLMRPFIKLGEDNKPVKDRPFQPKLPIEPLLEWGKQTKWEKGGIRPPPQNASQPSLHKRAQELQEPLPPKPRAAWQFYAEELIQKATNARDRLEGDDVAVRQLITDEVRGLNKKRLRWVLPHAEEHLGEAGKGGKWAQLSAVDQEKYIKMHNEDVKRYDHQMEAWHRKHPEVHSKAAEQCIQRIAARKAQEAQEAQEHHQRQQKEHQQQQQVQQGGGQHQQDVQQQQQQQQQGEVAAGESEEDSKRQRVGEKGAKETRRKGAGQQRKQGKGKKARKGEQEEEEAEEGQSDEEDEEYQSEASQSEDYLDAESEHEEDDEHEQQPRKKQQKASSPGRKVLVNAASKLNTPTKAEKRTGSKLSPAKIGGVVTKQPTSPSKLGGVVASPTRSSARNK
ncbi:hypothetical protein DUNSADRAFT_2517 [Dunaliella salina]|uniref:HMG box domain-containing protein n=1 Tax=Dunaliella salina TaxID=3046 RepID=A0ABQ7GVI8_DUNSA|nr:hypothetical protein DUNSADRAFT_2517 [Dunaliella salina]|eukprot:KAF5838608.1 hypothetical protein DUNSADRAFT_2517 [Dunaliella salina]